MSQLSRNWHKREIKIGTSVNFCLIERVRFVAQACFLGPDSERFTPIGKHLVFVAGTKGKKRRGER
jgi:hypothetical protein